MKFAQPRFGLLCLAAALAGCGVGADEAPPVAEQDPAITQALNDQLMADPDLANQNEANAALTFSIDHSLPTERWSDESVRRARAMAAEMVGGEQRLVLPESSVSAGGDAFSDGSAGLGSKISVLPNTSGCASRLNYSAIWAARMPEIFPVYPQGATQIAAGASDEQDCDIRATRFHSAAALDDIAAFYAARAKMRGFEVEYFAAGDAALIKGQRGSGHYRVELRTLPDGLVEVDLITNRI